MMIYDINVIKLDEDMDLPKYETSGAAGMDLMSASKITEVIGPGEIKLIKTGIKMELPVGIEAQVRARSGLALKHGITVLNGIGTIDCDFRGEIGVILINHSKEPFEVAYKDKIAQLVFNEYVVGNFKEAVSINSTGRGEGAYGHTSEKK